MSKKRKLLLSLPKSDKITNDGEELDLNKYYDTFTDPNVDSQNENSAIELEELLKVCKKQRIADANSIEKKDIDIKNIKKKEFDKLTKKKTIQYKIDKLTAELESISIDNKEKKKQEKKKQISRNDTLHVISNDMDENDGSLCCWWCTEPFKGMIYHSPERYIRSTKQFEVTGCFCGFECVLAFKVSYSKSIELVNPFVFQYIRSICKMGFSESVNIKKAQHFTLLKKYGGTLTIEEFRDKFKRNIKFRENYDTSLYKEKSYIETVKRNLGNNDIENVVTKELKLKRTKPLPDAKKNVSLMSFISG